MAELTHVDEKGKARMVDITAKVATVRTAEASVKVITSAEVIDKIRNNNIVKGDVLAVARVAGIMAAKKTSSLIPLCHPIPLEKVEIDFSLEDNYLLIKVIAKTTAKTGLEMEALTAASVTALTVYDMCKAVDKSMLITDLRLERKSGGKSGDFTREVI